MRATVMLLLIVSCSVAYGAVSTDAGETKVMTQITMLRLANISWKHPGENDLVVIRVSGVKWRAFYRENTIDFEYSDEVKVVGVVPIAGVAKESNYIVSSDAGVILSVSGDEMALSDGLKKIGIFPLLRRAIVGLKLYKRDWVRDVFETENRETTSNGK